MIIKKLQTLAKFIKPEQINRLEAGANLHKRYSNIEFKILDYAGNKITIEAKQGKHLSKNYADEITLTQCAQQLFYPSLPENTEVIVKAVPYAEHPISSIDAGWIDQQMANNHIRIRDIVTDTGLDKSNLSAWLNEKRPMSQIVKTMFYYYFQNRNKTTVHKKAS